MTFPEDHPPPPDDMDGGPPAPPPAPPLGLFELLPPPLLLLLALSLLVFDQVLTGLVWDTPLVAVAPVVAIVLPLAYLLRRLELPVAAGLGLRPLRLSQVAGTVLVLAGSLPLVYLLADLGESLYPVSREYQERLRELVPQNGLDWGVGILQIVVLGPLGEELLFRHLVQGALRQRMGTAAALLLASLLFAGIHMAPWLVLPLTLLGMVLGMLVLWTRTLTAAWLGHLLFNAVGYAEIVASGAEDPSMTSAPVALSVGTRAAWAAAGGVVFALGAWVLRRSRPA